MCDHHFDNGDESGQDQLDSASTLFDRVKEARQRKRMLKDIFNAKLIELAGAVAQRHRERMVDVDALMTTAATLAHRYCAPATHIAGVRRSNRSAGGLVLRR